MPRMTAKYRQAITLAHSLDLAATDNQESLYLALLQRGYQWGCQAGAWQSLANQPADAPTKFILVRLWCDAEVIQEIAEGVVGQLEALGLRLAEQSAPYPCRPPKQLESRVYLRFFPEKHFKSKSSRRK